MTPAPPAPPVPIPYPNLGNSVQMAGLATLSTLLLKAAGSGYALPKILFKPNGNGTNDDEFIIFLR
jgi:hypothetical protein